MDESFKIRSIIPFHADVNTATLMCVLTGGIQQASQMDEPQMGLYCDASQRAVPVSFDTLLLSLQAYMINFPVSVSYICVMWFLLFCNSSSSILFVIGTYFMVLCSVFQVRGRRVRRQTELCLTVRKEPTGLSTGLQ